MHFNTERRVYIQRDDGLSGRFVDVLLFLRG